MADDFRGVVVSVPVRNQSGGLAIYGGSLDPQELRFSLIFWDRIDFPNNNLIGFNLNEDSEFLQQEGILQRTKVLVDAGAPLAEGFRQAHVSAFNQLEQQNPGAWCVATGLSEVAFLDHDLEAKRGALVSLHRALPVPDKAVPLAEILEFRAKRLPELLALRATLDQAYLKIVSAPDRALAQSAEVLRVEQACADYLASAKGFGLNFRMADFDASLNLVGLGASSLAAFTAGMSVTQALGSIAAAAFSLNVGSALKAKAPSDRPYQYVVRYHDEVFSL